MFTNPLHEKADEALKNGDIEKAILLFTEALELNPNDYNIISDRGVAYLQANDKEKCFADFNRAIELQPHYSYRYACRAFAKNNFGDLDGAVEDYQKAVELDPTDAVAQNNLGILLEKKGYQDEADARFERADALSKQEDGLLNFMDDLETDDAENLTSITRKEIEPAEKPELKTSPGIEFKKVFTSKKQFDEFMQFIKNGFRIK